MQSSHYIEFNIFSNRPDTNCSVYLKVAFMTVFALILWLLSEGGYYMKTAAINW